MALIFGSPRLKESIFPYILISILYIRFVYQIGIDDIIAYHSVERHIQSPLFIIQSRIQCIRKVRIGITNYHPIFIINHTVAVLINIPHITGKHFRTFHRERMLLILRTVIFFFLHNTGSLIPHKQANRLSYQKYVCREFGICIIPYIFAPVTTHILQYAEISRRHSQFFNRILYKSYISSDCPVP